jgi:hypothetical protein
VLQFFELLTGKFSRNLGCRKNDELFCHKMLEFLTLKLFKENSCFLLRNQVLMRIKLLDAEEIQLKISSIFIILMHQGKTSFRRPIFIKLALFIGAFYLRITTF